MLFYCTKRIDEKIYDACVSMKSTLHQSKQKTEEAQTSSMISISYVATVKPKLAKRVRRRRITAIWKNRLYSEYMESN